MRNTGKVSASIPLVRSAEGAQLISDQRGQNLVRLYVHLQVAVPDAQPERFFIDMLVGSPDVPTTLVTVEPGQAVEVVGLARLTDRPDFGKTVRSPTPSSVRVHLGWLGEPWLEQESENEITVQVRPAAR